MPKFLLAFALVATTLSGCIANDGERALGGAVAGAVIADATGGDPLTGALIGVGVGTLCDDAGVCQ